MPTKIYISGKISGLPEKEAEQNFQKAEDYLKQTYPAAEIVNPFKIDHPHDKSWENYMRYDLMEMLKCDSIFMLNNWKESKGARIEYSIAKLLKINILTGSIEVNVKNNQNTKTKYFEVQYCGCPLCLSMEIESNKKYYCQQRGVYFGVTN